MPRPVGGEPPSRRSPPGIAAPPGGALDGPGARHWARRTRRRGVAHHPTGAPDRPHTAPPGAAPPGEVRPCPVGRAPPRRAHPVGEVHHNPASQVVALPGEAGPCLAGRAPPHQVHLVGEVHHNPASQVVALPGEAGPCLAGRAPPHQVHPVGEIHHNPASQVAAPPGEAGPGEAGSGSGALGASRSGWPCPGVRRFAGVPGDRVLPRACSVDRDGAGNVGGVVPRAPHRCARGLALRNGTALTPPCAPASGRPGRGRR
ncbi:hypothetical protein DFQ13_10560 [Actinokineospora spheciospongiae]|nr:hypothetical protein DFQ13_10560 [Actinokineospora spheciospongiae]